MFAVADFGGSLFIFLTESTYILPSPIFTVLIGKPIRTIVWCPFTNNIVIGCVGGSLYWWQYGNTEATFIQQTDHTFNILRAAG